MRRLLLFLLVLLLSGVLAAEPELDYSFLGWSKFQANPRQLADCVALDLTGNNFTELPEALAKAVRLDRVSLRDNDLVVLTGPRLKVLSRVRLVDLADNRLRYLGEDCAGWTRLEGIDLSGNRLAELPRQIGSWRRLRVLLLQQNRLERCPPEVRHLRNLRRLDLSDNRLSAWPDMLGSLPHLEVLHLEENDMRAVPKEMPPMPRLRELTVDAEDLPRRGFERVPLLRDLYVSGKVDPHGWVPRRIRVHFVRQGPVSRVSYSAE